jgi:hypothetical protein
MNNTCSENARLVTQIKSYKMENVGNYTNCRNTVVLSHSDSYCFIETDIHSVDRQYVYV